MNLFKISKMTYYHASPDPNLDKKGLNPNSIPLISMDRQNYVYLGSLNYILDHYLAYAPSNKYYIYKVDVTGLTIDDNLPGEQIRIRNNIDSHRVELFDIINSQKKFNEREEEYIEWAKELGEM